MNVGIVGCGVFGLAAAIELRARGHHVTAFEQGPIPSPNASSYDTSKTIRRVYGDQTHYVELVERSHDGWARWQERTGGDFFQRVGYIYVVQDFSPGTRVRDSWHLLGGKRDELRLVPLDQAREQFPQFAFKPGDTVLHDRWGGYLASARAVAAVAELARADGVDLRPETRVTEVTRSEVVAGDRHHFDGVIVAAGVWIPRLVPAIKLAVTRQPMAFFRPPDPERYRPGPMPVFSVRSDAPGYWYGHPLAHEGLVKVADDERGEPVDPDASREAPPGFVERVRAFVAERMPELAEAEIVSTRSCFYEDTPDRDFVVDWVDDVLVAGGGSGHGFKFGGSIGGVIADVLEHRDNPLTAPFRIGQRFA